MLAPATPENGVWFVWYQQDETTLAIANFVVHAERRRGTGTKVFQQWEQSIPPEITHIELRAKNADAEAFWSAMGFTPHPQLGRNCDGELYMVKPVNQPVAEMRLRPSGLSL